MKPLPTQEIATAIRYATCIIIAQVRCKRYHDKKRRNMFDDIITDYKVQILAGCDEPECALSIIGNNWIILSKVFDYVDNHYKEYYEKHIDKDTVSFMITEDLWSERPAKIVFPEATGININMMPINLLDMESLPDYCKPYEQIIKYCCQTIPAYDYLTYVPLHTHIGYLTIQESNVENGHTQRRPGLHIESPLKVVNGGKTRTDTYVINWGRGTYTKDKCIDGIYMASNVSDSCAVWPALIVNPEDVIDKHGSIEQMRRYLGPGRTLRDGELCWFTDRTPHESLPVPQDTQRTFFRLVVGPVSVWYSKHNTPNPMGVLPDCPISDEDKFK